jgi:hypothetical protein
MIQKLFSSFSDKKIEGLRFDENKKIHYLPENVSDVFLSINAYSAGDCSVREISKRNFLGMFNMKVLYLYDNLIEVIPNDTFEDLTELLLLWLRKKNST